MLFHFGPVLPPLFLLACTVGVEHAHAAEAIYRVTFEHLWNPTDHPLNYPSNAHFSPVIGTAHNAGVSFWAPGELATAGVELVAEDGVTRTFAAEVSRSTRAGHATNAVVGSDVELTVSDEFPLVTFLTMVAPTPDWFVGVHDVDLRAAAGPGFVESRVFEFTSFYDAGTEEGALFSMNNDATNPQQLIREIAGVDAARIFVDAQAAAGAQIAPIARFIFTRLSQTIPEPSSVALAGLAALGGLAWRFKKPRPPGRFTKPRPAGRFTKPRPLVAER